MHLNERVGLWSFFECMLVITLAAGQVFVLRSWFHAKDQMKKDMNALALCIAVCLLGYVIFYLFTFMTREHDVSFLGTSTDTYASFWMRNIRDAFSFTNFTKPADVVRTGIWSTS